MSRRRSCKYKNFPWLESAPPTRCLSPLLSVAHPAGCRPTGNDCHPLNVNFQCAPAPSVHRTRADPARVRTGAPDSFFFLSNVPIIEVANYADRIMCDMEILQMRRELFARGKYSGKLTERGKVQWKENGRTGIGEEGKKKKKSGVTAECRGFNFDLM